METVTLHGSPTHLNGYLPKIGSALPSATLVDQDLSEKNIETYKGKKKILNIFPSVDTATCAVALKSFHKELKTVSNVIVLNISKDLPFALSRFCNSEGIENAISLSAFRSNFARDYGIEIIDGALKGLCSRAVIVADETNTVLHTELVKEITNEPNYAKAIANTKS